MSVSDPSLLDNLDPDENFFSDFSQTDALTVAEFESICHSSSCHTVFSHNIRSFNRNSDQLLALFSTAIYPEIVVCSETWFTDEYSETIDGYSAYHTVRTNQRSGGVSVFIKESLVSRTVSHLTYCSDSIEVCSVETKLGGETVVIIGIYRPIGGSVDDFINVIQGFLNDSYLHNKKCVILGDMNINLLSDSNSILNFISLMHSLLMLRY